MQYLPTDLINTYTLLHVLLADIVSDQLEWLRSSGRFMDSALIVRKAIR
jgi:hypothetical protein